MIYLRVKNWTEFQHYKDRNPPWIKLHRCLLDDYEFSCLQDASKAHLMLIWLFASQSDGRIPSDPKFLKSKLGLDKEPDIKTLVDQGFLVPEQSASADASNTLASCSPETETYKATDSNGSRRNGAHHESVDNSPVVETLPVLGGSFEVRQSLVAELELLCPKVDIPVTLREMKLWLVGNPDRLKTRKGMRRFISGWLSREQQKAEALKGAH